jgi:hypothetical protein
MSGFPGGMGAGGEQASAAAAEEAQLRADYEAELNRITSTDLMLQAAVSLLNIAGRRLGPPPGAPPAGVEGQAGSERDLEQVRDAIDGVRALLEILERRRPGELGPLRDALAQLQLAYAREAQGAAGERPDAEPPEGEQAASGQPGTATPPGSEPGAEEQRRPGPAESSGRLWVPGR